jgi:hypothetical protein
LRRSLLGAPLLFAVLLASCGKTSPATNKDGSMGGIDAGGFADGGTLSSCLERPGDPPRPPNGQLPCELIPPNLR